MKRFLITSGILFGLALILAIVLFVYLSMTLPPSSASSVKDQTNAPTAKNEAVSTTSSSTTKVIELNEEQKERIEAHGIDSDKLVITEAMMECIQKKVDEDRIKELLNGAKPSFLELGIASLCLGAE